jgi:hypothetical protein
MFRIFFAIVILAGSIDPCRAQEASDDKVQHVKDILTVWSLTRAPSEKPSHTYILTHGFGGIDDRFFDMGRVILEKDKNANVLVVDWSPGANQAVMRIPNPLAAANRIDLTGDMLSVLLTKLHKKNCFDPEQATFIGESFGNCVNHRAALSIRKNGLKKPERALVLNPAPYAGYQTPVFTVAFKRSIACVSESVLDSRAAIANQRIALKTGGGPIEQHTHGMRWLQSRLDAGDSVSTLFTK